MSFLMFVLLSIGSIACGILYLNCSKEEKAARANLRLVSSVLFLLSLVFLAFASWTPVDAGTVKVLKLFGDTYDEPLKPGGHFVNPLCRAVEISVRTENYWMSHVTHEGQNKHSDPVLVRSKDGLQMPIDVSVPYRLLPSAVVWTYENLGDNYVEKILRPALSTVTRRAASKYTAEELYSSKLEEFNRQIQSNLESEIKNILNNNYEDAPAEVLGISEVLVGYIGIPDTVKNAIEAKLKADQEQQAMSFMLLKEKQEAERKEIEAKGIQTFQEIVSQGIDENLLKWKAIEATLELSKSNNSKVVVVGGKDGLPIILGDK